MGKNFIEKMYDMAGATDEEGLSKLDEQKLRKQLENDNKMFSRNKDVFSKEEPRFHTCSLYNPCPICDKCMNKASHLYIRCQSCQIPICIHTYENRKKMIKRYNFRCVVSRETYKKLHEIYNNLINERNSND